MEYNTFYDNKSLRVTYEEIEDGGSSNKDNESYEKKKSLDQNGMKTIKKKTDILEYGQNRYRG